MTASGKEIPDTMHLLFERGLFLGAFEDREAAERTKAAREKGGKGPLEIGTFRKVPQEPCFSCGGIDTHTGDCDR